MTWLVCFYHWDYQEIRSVFEFCEYFNTWSISIITYSQTSDGYPTGYQISRIDHHKTSKLSSVFQRWDKQLFMSIYDESKCTENIVEPVRVTRQALELNLRQYKLHNKKYTKSP